MTHDELNRLREILEGGREPTPQISAFQKTVLLIKAKLARPTEPKTPTTKVA